MFDSPEKLKEFVLWCKQEKIKSFKINDMEFEVSEIAFIPEDELPGDVKKEFKNYDDRTFADTETVSKEEEDELLYWSSRN